MAELVWFLLQLVLEILGEALLGILWELLVSLYQATFDRSNRGALLEMCGYFIVGALTGAGSLYFWPERVLHVHHMQGISLVLAPLCVGWALSTWGNLRRSRGYVTSGLATFHAGAAYGFGAALTRFIWVG